MPSRHRQDAVVAALASATVLGAQVLLPRVFSVLLWYHLGFLAVSLALLGYAAGGVLVRRRVLATGLPGGGFDPAVLALGAALALPLALLLVVRLPLQPNELLDGWQAPVALLAMGIALAAPFTLLGTLVCVLLDRAAERLGACYAATFLGGAAGAGLTLLAMDHLDPPAVLALLAALPLLGALLSGSAVPPWCLQSAGKGSRPRSRTPRLLLLSTLLLLLGLCLAPQRTLPIESRKHFPRVPPERVLEERWNSFSRVTVYDNPEHHGLWELPAFYTGPLPDTIGVAIDAWAITPIVKRAPGRDLDPVFPYYPPTLFYEGAAPGFDALVIGAGGGIDVQAALAAGARHVTAVEINPLIVDAVRGRFSDWCGGLYDDPRVQVVVAEGRDFLHRDPRQYDRIVLSGVDTFAATEAGAFALSENYLYTTEALAALTARLVPGGVLGMTRWWFEPPRQTLRLALTAAAVLAAQGVEQPGLRMFIARAGRNTLFLLRNGEFSPPMVEQLLVACAQRGAEPVFARDTPSHPHYVSALTLPDPAHFIESYPYRIDPTTDDRPFFFEYSRLGTLFRSEGDWVRDRLGGQELLVLSLASLLLLAAPLLLLARRPRVANASRASAATLAADTGRVAGVPGADAARGGVAGGDVVGAQVAGGGFARGVLPFALLGFGYLLVELPLMQRLALPLGHPALAVAVVLVALLLWSGCGALLSARVPVERRPRLLSLLLLATALAVVALPVGAHDALLSLLASAGPPARIAVVLAFLAVPGLLLGMPFPVAVRRLRAQSAGRGAPGASTDAQPAIAPAAADACAAAALLSSAFLANGLASVICGPLAMMLAMEAGFRVTLLAGAACYVAAALLWWPQVPADAEVDAGQSRPPR